MLSSMFMSFWVDVDSDDIDLVRLHCEPPLISTFSFSLRLSFTWTPPEAFHPPPLQAFHWSPSTG